jgi:hypothetical protein
VRILFVGAPAWNPERLRSLAEQGHELLGLWGRSMAWDQGPYPVLDGAVRTVPLDDLRGVLRATPPDIVCGLFQVYGEERWAPPTPGVEHGVWTLLRRVLAERHAGTFDAPVAFHYGFDVHVLDLGVLAVLDAQVFCNEELLAFWTGPAAEGGRELDVVGSTPVVGFLDGDRPMARFMGDDLTEPLSDSTGEVHTACIGRPLGIDYVAAARAGIHVHIYGNAFDDVEAMLVRDVGSSVLGADLRRVREHVHLHGTRQLIGETWPVVEREKATWVPEFSQYDAGWSYVGPVFSWTALEDRAAIPNRLGTYLLAGLPVITPASPGTYRYDVVHRVGASIDLTGDDYPGLRARLDEERSTRRGRKAALAARLDHSFEGSIGPLLDLFERAREAYLAVPDPERRRVPAPPLPLVRVGGGVSLRPARRWRPREVAARSVRAARRLRGRAVRWRLLGARRVERR